MIKKLDKEQQRDAYMDWLLYYVTENHIKNIKRDSIQVTVINNTYIDSAFKLSVIRKDGSFVLGRIKQGSDYIYEGVHYFYPILTDDIVIVGDYGKILYLFKDSIDLYEIDKALYRKYGSEPPIGTRSHIYSTISELFSKFKHASNIHYKGLVNFDVVTNPHSGMLGEWG